VDAPDCSYTTTLDGARIAYWTIGSEPPLLLHLSDVPTPSFATMLREPTYGPYFEALRGAGSLASFDFRGVGLSQAALDEAVKYAQTRETFGQPIAQHQAIQLNVADMVTRTEAARLLTYRAAEAYDRGERCDMEAGMAKLFATEAAVTNSMDSMRVHGGYGYSKEFPVERYYRDAPLLTIGEGTNELQRIIIARQLFARNPI